MAPRIKVPADFGREHINSDVHGNLILKLKDGEQIRANSMIMSLNSPVINNLISDLCQSTLEMDDFSSEVVNCFVDCMYTGEIEKLQKDIFEDVNKMAHAFKVSWLSKKCLKFYQTNILNFDKNTYDEILFACEIASRAHTNLKQTKFVKYFLKTASSWKSGKSIFIQRYMADFAQLSKRQINMSLAIAEDEVNLVTNCLVSHLSIALRSKGFDDNSLYVLENIDLEKFAAKFPSHYMEFCHFINEISESSASERIQSILDKLVGVKTNKTGEILGDISDSTSQSAECAGNSSYLDDCSDDELKSCAIQTDAVISTNADWTKITCCGPDMSLIEQTTVEVHNRYFNLTTIEMVTTKNDTSKTIVFRYQSSVEENDAFASLFIRCTDAKLNRWTYVLEGCTNFTFGDREVFFKNIPNSKVKMWKITKTYTEIAILCNNVSLLNFNFEKDSIESCRKSCKRWSRRPQAIGILSQFLEHTFVKVT